MKTNTWLDLKNPSYTASIGIATTLLKENIYVLGGGQLIKDYPNHVNDLSACVSQYSIGTNSWSKLQNLPKPLVFSAAASHGNYVFCAGGWSPDSYSIDRTDKLYVYDIVGKIWLSKASMNSGRRKFCLEAVGEKLIACGGLNLPNVEIYDTADDQWTLL